VSAGGVGGVSGSVRCTGSWAGRSVKRGHPGALDGGAGPGPGRRAAAGGSEAPSPVPAQARFPAGLWGVIS